jgi:hypothetical protein
MKSIKTINKWFADRLIKGFNLILGGGNDQQQWE